MQKKHWLFLVFLTIALTAYGIRLFAEQQSSQLILYGNVDQRQVELSFKESERVAEVFVEEGALVEKGQVLATLETRRLRDRLAVLKAQCSEAQAMLARLENGTRPEEIDQAKAEVIASRADLDYAEKHYRRLAEILRHSQGKGARQADLDEALARRDAARAKLVVREKALRLAEIGPRLEEIEQARAVLAERQNALIELQNRLDDAKLQSPSRSYVHRRLLEPGDMASPDKAVFSLAVLSPKWVRAYVSEPDLGRIRQGMAAIITTDSFSKGITGHVGFISQVAEFTPKTVETTELRTSLVYEVRIVVEDRDDRLRLGMPATVTFSEENPTP